MNREICKEKYVSTEMNCRQISVIVHLSANKLAWFKRSLNAAFLFLDWASQKFPQSDLWKWRNDRRSERNLCNCVKKSEKKRKIQDFNGVWTRDLAITIAMLYQLSYEATDVGSRSIVGSYVPVKEMSVNDIWNES